VYKCVSTVSTAAECQITNVTTEKERDGDEREDDFCQTRTV